MSRPAELKAMDRGLLNATKGRLTMDEEVGNLRQVLS